MPYIKQEKREKLKESIESLSKIIDCDGDLNYVITSLVHKELIKRGMNYQNMNNLIGALECAKTEFSRVVIAPYENVKKFENGSVSELDKDFLK